MLAKIAAGLNVMSSWIGGEEFAVAVAPPQSIGRCADTYHDIRELRLQADKLAKSLKAAEDAVENYIVENVDMTKDTGASGLRYRAQVVVKAKPTAKDWGVIQSWIRKNDRFDMLDKRLNKKAIEDMWADGKEVPGVEKFLFKDVSVTKIS